MHFLLYVCRILFFAMSLERIVRSEDEAQLKELSYGSFFPLSLLCFALRHIFIWEEEHGSEPELSKRVRACSVWSLDARLLAGHLMCMACLSSMNKTGSPPKSRKNNN